MHIYISKLCHHWFDNGLSPVWWQPTIWTNDGLLSIRPWRTYSIETLVEIQVLFKKMHLKMSSAKMQPSCLSINVFNTLRLRQNGRRFTDDIFKRIFLNENVRISIKISLKFVPRGPINIIPALVQIMAWRRPGDKPLSEPMLVFVPTHKCVTRPQWVKPWRLLKFILS